MCSITMQNLKKIVQCAPAVGSKKWCLTLSFYWQDAYAGIKFTHKPKISIFAPQGQLIAQIYVKFGMTKGHMGPLGYTKFHTNPFMGVGTWLQNIKNFDFFFGKRSPLRGEPLDQFLKFYGLLYDQWSYINVSNLMSFASQVTELLLKNCTSVN